jgi:hypothetical protein
MVAQAEDEGRSRQAGWVNLDRQAPRALPGPTCGQCWRRPGLRLMSCKVICLSCRAGKGDGKECGGGVARPNAAVACRAADSLPLSPFMLL